MKAKAKRSKPKARAVRPPFPPEKAPAPYTEREIVQREHIAVLGSHLRRLLADKTQMAIVIDDQRTRIAQLQVALATAGHPPVLDRQRGDINVVEGPR